MSWKEDRDALIAQTMAFVQSVSRRGQISRAESAERAELPPVVQALDAGPVQKPMPPRAPVAEASTDVPGSAQRQVGPGEMANEIRARIASFRAHQERFNREREEYFSKTLARLKATLNERPTSRSEK